MVGFQLDPKTVTSNRELNQQTLIERFAEEPRRSALTFFTNQANGKR
jgi:hypothetical protein